MPFVNNINFPENKFALLFLYTAEIQEMNKRVWFLKK